MRCSSRPSPRSGPPGPCWNAPSNEKPGSDRTPADAGRRREWKCPMVIRDLDRDRQYALVFARGALEHYYSVGPDQLQLRERATNLTTGDMLAIAVEQLLDELDPVGPKPWLR